MKDVETPIGEKGSITIDAWEVASAMSAGFRQEWIDAADDGCEMVLAVGAGCGSKWGTFRYTRLSDGAQVRLAFDGTDLVMALTALAQARLEERAS